MPNFSVTGSDGVLRNLHYHERGDGDILFLLHGWYQNSLEIFSPYIDHFSNKYKVIVPDLPGHGLSYNDKSIAYSIDDACSAIVSLLEHLKAESTTVHIVGCSLGAYIALKIAIENPDLVENVVLISLFLDFKQNELEIEKLTRLSSLPLLIALWLKARKGSFPFDGRKLRFWQYNGKMPSRWRHFLQKMENHSLYAARGYISSFLRSSLIPGVEKNSQPTLLIYGQKDSQTPRDFATSLANKMTSAKLQIVDHSGHSVYLTKPNEVIKLIDEFLKENRKRRFQWLNKFWKR
ncbi:MAG: alpha/beta hydrolase [Leptospirales bacterium]